MRNEIGSFAVEEDILKPLSMSQRIRIKNKLVERGIM